MIADPYADLQSVTYSTKMIETLQRLRLARREVTSALKACPPVKRLHLPFTDPFQHWYTIVTVASGKKIGVIFYRQGKSLHPTRITSAVAASEIAPDDGE